MKLNGWTRVAVGMVATAGALTGLAGSASAHPTEKSGRPAHNRCTAKLVTGDGVAFAFPSAACVNNGYRYTFSSSSIPARHDFKHEATLYWQVNEPPWVVKLPSCSWQIAFQARDGRLIATERGRSTCPPPRPHGHDGQGSDS